MWQQKTVTHKAELADTAVNAALQSALGEALPPADLVEPNATQPQAESDTARRAIVPAGQVEALAVTPWADGEHSRNKRDAGWYLTPTDAQERLKKRLADSGWQSAILVMTMADNPQQLKSQLQQIEKAFEVAGVSQAMRRATALATHEEEKRFIAGEEIALTGKKSSLGIKALSKYAAARQGISVSEAVASDKSATAMLQAFIQKRADRLQEIEAAAAEITAEGGSLEYCAVIEGGDLASKVTGTPPNEQAPLCCIIAIGGAADEIEKIKEATGL